jgi:hypothetical protein
MRLFDKYLRIKTKHNKMVVIDDNSKNEEEYRFVAMSYSIYTIKFDT